MECTLEELRYREVISVTDGTRYGYVSDLSFDLDTGQVRGLLVPGQGRFFFGLLGRREVRLVPWQQVRRFGADIILVEGEPSPAPRQGKKAWAMFGR